MTPLQISLLGPVQIHLAEKPIPDISAHKNLALLAYLAVEAETAPPRDSLAGLLWPEQPMPPPV